VSSAVAALGSFSAAAVARGTHGADLAITHIAISELPGSPPYITLDESARAPGFVVKVSVRNNGSAASGQSVVALKLEEKGKQKWFKDEFIGPQAPRSQPMIVKFAVDNLKADLGFLTATATAKWALNKTHVRQDSDSAKPIPVIARDWTVGYFHTRVNQGGDGPSSDTSAELKLTYHFSRFDESQQEFVYQANGQVTDQARYNGGGCSAQGSANATQSPWPGPGTESELIIKSSLTQYLAGVVTSTQPPITLNVTCPGAGGFGFPVQVPWEDLLTFTGSKGLPSMTPDQTTLTDEGTKRTPVGDIKFLWNFVARLSGA